MKNISTCSSGFIVSAEKQILAYVVKALYFQLKDKYQRM
jgi:hypothetical protein